MVLILSCASTFAWWSKTFVQFWLMALWGTFLWNYFEFRPVFQEKCTLEIFCIYSSCPFVLWSGIICAILAEGITSIIFEIILFEFGPVVQEEMLFLTALLFGGAESFVQLCQRTLLGAFLWNYFRFGTMVQEMLFKYISILSSAWMPYFSEERNYLCTFGKCIMRSISVKLFWIRTSG